MQNMKRTDCPITPLNLFLLEVRQYE
jgi:hypothetical protein